MDIWGGGDAYQINYITDKNKNSVKKINRLSSTYIPSISISASHLSAPVMYKETIKFLHGRIFAAIGLLVAISSLFLFVYLHTWSSSADDVSGERPTQQAGGTTDRANAVQQLG
jgi:hypothetical protein